MNLADEVDSDTAPAAEGGKRTCQVPAAEKTLDILEFLAGQPDGLTVTEIVGALGRTVHELYRVVLVLEARGYLYRRAGLAVEAGRGISIDLGAGARWVPAASQPARKG